MTSENPPYRYKCKICSKVIDNMQDSLVEHLENEHKIVVRTLADIAKNFKPVK